MRTVKDIDRDISEALAFINVDTPEDKRAAYARRLKRLRAERAQRRNYELQLAQMRHEE